MPQPFRIASALALVALGACGDDASPDVVIDTRYRYGAFKGAPRHRDTITDNRVFARLYVGGDPTKTLDGTFGDGFVRFEDAPNGWHAIETRVSPSENYPDDLPYMYRIESERRNIQYGMDAGYRDEATILAEDDGSTAVALDFDGLAPTGAEDTWFQLYSANAEFLRTFSVWQLGGDPPADGSETISGFSYAIQDMTGRDYRDGTALLDPAAGDDFAAFQMRSIDGPPPGFPEHASFDPWQFASHTHLVTRVELPEAPALVEHATTPLPLTFEPFAPEPFAIDYRGDEFQGWLEATGAPDATRVYSWVDVIREPGDGKYFLNGAAPTIWSTSLWSSDRPVDPYCYPDAEGECDLTCGGGTGICDESTDGWLHPGNVTFYAPIADPLAGIPGSLFLTVNYRFGNPTRFPFAVAPRSIYAYSSVSFELDLASGRATLAPSLGAPTNLQVEDVPLPWVAVDAPGSITELTDSGAIDVRWDAPAGEAPQWYKVSVIEVADTVGVDGSVRNSRITALVYTRSTSTWIDRELFRDGMHYYIRVGAMNSNRPLDDARRQPRAGREEIIETASAVFTL